MTWDRGVRWAGLLALGLLAAFRIASPGQALGEPSPDGAQVDLRQTNAQGLSIREALEAGQPVVWPGPATQDLLTVSLGTEVRLILERRTRGETVRLRRDGRFLVVDGPAVLRYTPQGGGTQRFDVVQHLGLDWGPPAAGPSPTDSELDVAAGAATVTRQETSAGAAGEGRPAPPGSTFEVAEGERAPLVENDSADLDFLSEAQVTVGGCRLTLLELTNMRVISIGEETTVVEVLGVELEMTRGTVLEAAFGSLTMSFANGTAIASVPQDGVAMVVRQTFLDPTTGVQVISQVTLAPGQSIGLSVNGMFAPAGAVAGATPAVTTSTYLAGQAVATSTATAAAPAAGTATTSVLQTAVSSLTAQGALTTTAAAATGTAAAGGGLATGSIIAVVAGVAVLGGVAAGAATVAVKNDGGTTGGNGPVGIVPPPPVSGSFP
jgi:hypothetical protein